MKRRIAKWIGGIIGGIILLIVIVVVVIYIPAVQNYVVKKVASAASESMGMDITVGHVRLAFPLDLLVEDVLVCQEGDTIANVGRVQVAVALWPLLRGEVVADELLVQSVQFDTGDMIAQMVLQGYAGELRLTNNDILLSSEEVRLDVVRLADATVDIQMIDTIVEDTTTSSEPVAWAIRVNTLDLSNSNIAFHMPGDTLSVAADVAAATLTGCDIDLLAELYTVSGATITAQEVRYDQTYEPHIAGFDYNHMVLSDVLLRADSVAYSTDGLFVHINQGAFHEQSGLTLSKLSGEIAMDSTTLYVRSLALSTPYSSLYAAGAMALDAFDDTVHGPLSLSATAELGRNDVLLFLTDMPAAFYDAYPYQPLAITADVAGSMKNLSVTSITAEIPTVIIASAAGQAGNLLDPDHLFADITIDVQTHNIAPLVGAFLDADTREMITIPSLMTLDGGVTIDGNTYAADLTLREGTGTISIDASCTLPEMVYAAAIAISDLDVTHFVKGLDLAPLSMTVTAEGSGTDFFDPHTTLTADIGIDTFSYADFALDGATVGVAIDDGVAHATLTAANSMLQGDITVDALLSTDHIKGTMGCAIDSLDMRALGITDKPLMTSLCSHIDIESDMIETHSIEAFIGDVVIIDSTTVYRAYDMELTAFTRPDSTLVSLASGDLRLLLAASGGYMRLASLGTDLADELNREVERKYISQDTLLTLLPVGSLTIQSGKGNFVAGYAKRMGFDYNNIDVNITMSPVEGINGYAEIDSLAMSGIAIDTARVTLATQDDIFSYALYATNGATQEYPFTANLDGSLIPTGSNLRCRLYDSCDSLAVDLSLSAALEHNGILVRLTDTKPVIGYQTFTTNDDNYIFLSDDARVSADLMVRAPDGTAIQIYSDNENTTALQDITLDIENLNLAPIIAAIPFCPSIQGVLNGDFHVIITPDELSLSSTIGVDGLVYEGIEMGDIATEFVYMPLDNNTHYVDGILSHDGVDVGSITGKYTIGDDDDYLSATVALSQLPLNLANGFIPDMIIGLEGYGDGTLTVDGPLSQMDINGRLDLDSARLVSVPYGVELTIDNRPIVINHSRIVLDDFRLLSNNDEPLTINGDIDLSDMANMSTNLHLTANNWLVIDAKESRKSEAFGKAYINLDATATGPLSTMKIIGAVDVLGKTDVTYVLKDSPISTDNAMEGLVQFTDLSSDETISIAKPTIGGPYIDLRLTVEKDARIFVALNAIKTNYLDMTGGGDLRMVYSQNDIRLTGRYTIEEGEMKYSLPVIPLKTFNIAEGSYVEFTGELLDPTIDITATESTKANAMVNGVSQSVAFNCGVAITQTLSNMGLAFIIEAPENVTIDSELKAMSAEERGKVAVTLLTTGMYLDDNGLSSFSMNNALSAFLQNEINNISNSALRTLDLSIGIDNTTDATGDTHTDYTFKFAKRLWNNRVRIVIGGKVSSNNASADNIFDNVAFEYRLDKNSYTNLRLFYDRSTYDYLEGYVGQYGVGVMWTRQLQSFKELFHKNKKDTTPAETPPDELVEATEQQQLTDDEQPTEEGGYDEQE